MEWHALPHHCGFDFDTDSRTGYLTKFVIAPSSPTGEWAGLIRLFERNIDQKPWDLKRTYLDVEAEFVTCQLQLISARDGGLVVHLLSKSGKRGSLLLMNKKLAEMADKAKNFAAICVDKVKDNLYCLYNSRSEMRSQLELYKDVSSLHLNLKTRCPVPQLQNGNLICLQGNAICIAGRSATNQPIVSIIRKDSMQPINTINIRDPINIWFDNSVNLIEILHNNDKNPLKIITNRPGLQVIKTLPKMKKSKLTIYNDRNGKLYTNLKTNNEKLSNLFGPIELFYTTFQIEETTNSIENQGDKALTLVKKSQMLHHETAQNRKASRTSR